MTNQIALFEPASMVVCDNPLMPPREGVLTTIGTPLWELAPATQSPLMLRVNGQWLMRSHWWRPVLPGDVIEWHVIAMGGGGSRTLLQIILAVASAYVGGLPGLVLNLVGNALINALIPIQQPTQGTTQSPGSVYTVATSANQARLNQPIPVLYGRNLTYPDYAGQPYAEYANNDQFFYAVYTIGQGSYNIERLQIDDTPINHFQDVTYEVLPPGVQPTIARANVVTAPEVAGQDMKSGLRIGGFAACGPKSLCSAIGIDIVFQKGLGLANDAGVIGNLSATVQIDARNIDDFGVATGAWYSLGTETITRATSTPQRVTFSYTLPGGYVQPFAGGFRFVVGPGARIEVRVTRTDVRNDNIRALHDMAWGGLRAYLTAAAPLCATATHLAVRIRASEQLSGLSQRKIGIISRRKLRTWAANVWGPEIETRNPFWARLDKLTNTTYGDGLADSRIDLQTHADLAAVADARQDRLDIVFDSKVTSIDADRTMLMVCRSVPFQRAGVMTVARDSLQTLPVTAYTSRDIVPGSMTINYSLATELTADAVIVEYFDNRSWDWREVLCKAPGVTTPVNAVRQRIMGITGAKHAEREGLYMAAQNVYRRKFPKWTTEMQGLLPAYGSPVMFAPALPGWGQAGDVAFWNSNTLVMGLTEPAVFTAGVNHFISIVRDDGSVTPAIAVTPGPTEYDVVLASAPLMADNVTVFPLVLDDANRERSKFVFGASGQHRIMVRVLGIRKNGKTKEGAQLVEMSSVADDVRVHTVDNALLPGPGVIQDPVDSIPGGDTGGGSLTLVNLTDRNYTTATSSTNCTFTITFAPNGSVNIVLNGTNGSNTFPAGEWMQYGVIEATTAALYEVRLTARDGGALSSGTAGVWLGLGVSRAFAAVALNPGGTGEIPNVRDLDWLIEVREIASTLVQDSATYTVHLEATS